MTSLWKQSCRRFACGFPRRDVVKSHEFITLSASSAFVAVLEGHLGLFSFGCICYGCAHAMRLLILEALLTAWKLSVPWDVPEESGSTIQPRYGLLVLLEWSLLLQLPMCKRPATRSAWEDGSSEAGSANMTCRYVARQRYRSLRVVLLRPVFSCHFGQLSGESCSGKCVAHTKQCPKPAPLQSSSKK